MVKLEISYSQATNVFWEFPAVNVQVTDEKEEEYMYDNTIKLQKKALLKFTWVKSYNTFYLFPFPPY